MHNKPKRRGMQMTDRESDDCKVPSIAGNAEGGKAVRPSRDSSLAPNTRSGELAVISRLNRISPNRRWVTLARSSPRSE